MRLGVSTLGAAEEYSFPSGPGMDFDRRGNIARENGIHRLAC